jgi:hypothetical protein
MAGSAGSTSYAICDGDRLIEETGTGKLAIYYALEDAVAAFPAVKLGADKSMQAGLRICEVEISKPQRLPSPNIQHAPRPARQNEKETP